MKILFVTNKLGYTDNIAIAFLSAIAKQQNHKTFYCSLDRDNLSDKVKELKPDVVGYTAAIFDFKNIVNEHKKAREQYNFISIMGGSHPTTAPESFNESGIDAYCIGEGEYAFRDFLNCVENDECFNSIPNIVTAKRRNNVRPLIQNLDNLPMPDRDLIFSNTFLKDISKKTFFTSRGCPFSCSYCCNNVYHQLYKGKGNYVRKFSVDRIIKEINDVGSKYRMDFVKFDDDCFCLKVDNWLREFAWKYPKDIDIPFNCLLRFDLITDEMLHLLKKAGCHSVHLSVDSTSWYIREYILKRKMVEFEFIKILRKIRKYDINTYVNFMVAIPESRVIDDFNTILFSRLARITYPSYTTTIPMKQTELYNYCESKDYLGDYFDGEVYPDFYKESTLSCFSMKSKNIRQNVAMLGAVLSKLPIPLSILLTPLLLIPTNGYFTKLWKFVNNYYMKNKIYLLEN